MTTLDLNTTVGRWVMQNPRTSRIFESLQIDYCCGGKKALKEACRERNLEPEQVLSQLQQALNPISGTAETDWSDALLSILCDHIEQTHHAYLRAELPRLTSLIAKVVNAHGQSHPELPRLQEIFSGFRAELETHMLKEERVLFPAIRLLERSVENPSFPFGTVANPIRVMEHEHDNAGEALAQFRKLTNDFAIPTGACNTYRAMLDGLHQLELDMHQHVHKENNILFPRACTLERSPRIPV